MRFIDQAGKFLQDGAGRKRKPLRHNSLRAYRSDIEKHLAPFFGKMNLEDIDGKTVKNFVTYLSNLGLTGTTITRKVSLLKKILKSALDQNGNQLYPANWSSDYLDMPELAPKRPTVSGEMVTRAILSARKRYGSPSPTKSNVEALYAILAGTGMRIGEIMALETGPDTGKNTVWLPQESKVIVRRQKTKTGYGPPKTKAGIREIDLDSALNSYMLTVFGVVEPHPNIDLFECCAEKYRGDLKLDGVKGGFHVFRRFRITRMRLAGVPETMIDYWVGHAAETVTDTYAQVGGEIQSRKEWAAKAGLGFEL